MAQALEQFDLDLTRKRVSGSIKLRILLILPFVAVIAIFLFSPNYDSHADRISPFGGDFLQEWVGGSFVASGNAIALYDLESFKSLQHDEALVGFSWPAESYYPPIYPPFYYLVVSPFSAMEYRAAAILWSLLSAGALVITGELLIRFYAPGKKYVGYGLVIAMIFSPLLTCLNIGHKSTFLLLILTGTFLLLHRKRPFCAGVVFGLIAFKPHLLLLIGLTMLLKRQWNFVLGASLTLLCLAGLSLILGFEACWEYATVLLGTTNYIQSGGYELADAHSLWGAVKNALQGSSVFVVNSLTFALSLVVLGLLVFIFRGPLKTNSPRFALQFAALVLATILVSPHMYFYDLTIILLPLLLIFVAKDSVPPIHRRPTSYLTAVAVVILIGAGSFKEFASFTKIQPSVILMGVLIFVMAIVVQNMPVPVKRVRSAIGAQ